MEFFAAISREVSRNLITKKKRGPVEKPGRVDEHRNGREIF
jgi:hypothetical protein